MNVEEIRRGGKGENVTAGPNNYSIMKKMNWTRDK